MRSFWDYSFKSSEIIRADCIRSCSPLKLIVNHTARPRTQLPEILPVVRRGAFHDVFEIVVEIGQVVVSAFVTDLGDGFVSFNQHEKSLTIWADIIIIRSFHY